MVGPNGLDFAGGVCILSAMPRRVLLALAGCVLFGALGWRPALPGASRSGRPALRSLVADQRLLALERDNGCLDESSPAPAPQAWPDWAAAHIAGGDVPPTRIVSDPYPTLHSVAVDATNDRVFVSDPNRHALWSYDRRAASNGAEPVAPLTGIRGPATGMMFIAAVTVDPDAREVYTVDNDIGDRMMVFSYDADGNAKPLRALSVPHQAWGLSINSVRKEIAVSVEGPRQIVVYAQNATGSDAPLRMIRGPHTGLGDPHGVFFDGKNNEIVVANHGNQNGRETAPGSVAPARRGGGGGGGERGALVGGRFDEPSITVYPGEATGDVAPVRRIQGPKTGLNWPMAISVDAGHDEIAVANSGDSSIRIFSRTASGDAAPVRIIKGTRTGIHGPMGVTFDVKNDELWVANYGDHTALVFARGAGGDVAPKRIVRNAPAGSPTVGFGNPGAVAYDSKRDELLVPN
jgi:DNA-binding beta-propeller fold protein YncE